MDDQQLLARIRQDSPHAFDDVFRAYYPSLVGLAESIVQQRATAEDIAQDVLIGLWRRRHDLTIETSLRAYLFRATRNRALNRIRDERVRRDAEPHIAAGALRPPPTDAAAVQSEIEAALRAAVQTLPPRCREVFELSRVHGLAYAEIADVLGISVKTVENQMGKALRILREQLAPWLPEPRTRR